MRNGQEILDAYNNQSEQSYIDGDFSCLEEMIDEELDTLAEQRDELLAALKDARKWIGDGDKSEGLDRRFWTTEYGDLVDKIDAVISKATQ